MLQLVCMTLTLAHSDYTATGEDCFLASPAFVEQQGRPRLEMAGLKVGDGTPPTLCLNGSGQTWWTLVDNEARGSGASLHQGRSQLGLHISIAPIAIVTTEKLKI